MQVKDIVREDDGESQELVLTLVASAEEVDEAADKFFADIAKRDIPGFRKGKAPREVLEKQVGGHERAMGGVTEQLVNDLALAAIDDADVIYIDEPQFNVSETVEVGKPFTFTVSGKVAPIMKLTSCDPVSIEMPPEEATDAEVADQLAELQDYYHHFEDIDDPDHEAQMGEYVQVELTVDNHGRLISGMNQTQRMIGLGKGSMPPSFDEHLVGAKVDDTLEFDFEARDDEGNPTLGDGDLHANVVVKGIRRYVVPPVDDELALKVGCADVEDLRKQMRQAVNMHKRETLPKLMVDRAVDALLERLDGKVPSYYVDFIRQDVGREFMQSLDKQGMNLQQWMLQNKVEGDKMKEEVQAEAERRASIDCAMEALFTELGLEITDEDIDKMFEGAEGDEKGQKRSDWEGANRMANIRKMCRQRKVTAWLVDTASVTVVDDEGNVIEESAGDTDDAPASPEDASENTAE